MNDKFLPPGFAGAVTNTGTIVTERKYLPTFDSLVDRLSIVLLKSIFITEHRDDYREEMLLIECDLDSMLLETGSKLSAKSIRAILVIMLANRFIWENEAQAREDGGGIERLKLTHSVNGIRNTAKNVLARAMNQRLDYKIDCLAANLPAEFGNWKIFE